MDWNLEINPGLFNMLDKHYDLSYVNSYLDERLNNIDVEELCMGILLKREINIDELLKQVNKSNNILTILSSLKLTIKQKLKLIDKLNNSRDIFLASTTFTQEELFSLIQFPNAPTMEDLSKDKLVGYKSSLMNKKLFPLLLCYLYLYPSKKKFSKEQEKLVELLLNFLYEPHCIALITTDRFLSNFSSTFKKKFYTSLIFDISVRLFVFIDEIPEKLYEKCLTKLLKKNVPVEILLYSKCFHKDYEKFLQFTDIENFYSKLYEQDLLISYYECQYNPAFEDILTTSEYQKCMQYFFKKDQQIFYKILPKIINCEKNEERQAILNSYVLMKDLKN